MLTYSLRPRGGVVHALEISEALARRGHEVELFALGPSGEGFFREPNVPSRIVRYKTSDAPFDERVMAMLAAYRDGLAEPLARGGFDLIHPRTACRRTRRSSCATRVWSPHVIRTVHHVDDFTSPSLVECQDRSIFRPDALLCVSEPWVARLEEEFGFAPSWSPTGSIPPLSAGLGCRRARGENASRSGSASRFTVLTIGGIEPRKGSLTLLEGFAAAAHARARARPAAGRGRRRDAVRLPPRGRPLPRAGGCARARERVRVLGSRPDDQIESLYRAADAFAFPSTKEGFGLAALEALASRAAGGGIGPRRVHDVPV